MDWYYFSDSGVPSMSNMEDSSPFALQSDSSAFKSRTTDVFQQLNNLEFQHNAVLQAREGDCSIHNDDKLLMKSDPTDECESITSGFKKPDSIKGRPRKRNFQGHHKSLPGHLECPEKWKKYTLSDVSDDQLSQASNSKAAFAFLEERRKIREQEEEEEKMTEADVKNFACSKGLFSFKPQGTTLLKKSKLKEKSRDVLHTVSSDVQEPKDANVSNIVESAESVEVNKQTTGSELENQGEPLTSETGFKSRRSNARKQIRKREQSPEDDD